MVTAAMVKELREKTGAGMLDCKKALVETEGDMTKAEEYLREKGILKATKKESRIAAEGLASICANDKKAVILEVNSETDFVSKNEEFKSLVEEIGNTILNSDATTMEEALELPCDEGTLKDLLVAKIAKIGEKLSFRRFESITLADDECFGKYIHMGGKIASLVVLKGANEEVAKDVAMQQAAMKPEYTSIKDVPEDVVAREREIQKEAAMNEGKYAEIAEKMVEGRIQKFFKEICLTEQAFIKDGGISVATYVKNNGGEIVKAIRYEVGEGMEKRNDDFAAEVMNQVKGA